MADPTTPWYSMSASLVHSLMLGQAGSLKRSHTVIMRDSVGSPRLNKRQPHCSTLPGRGSFLDFYGEDGPSQCRGAALRRVYLEFSSGLYGGSFACKNKRDDLPWSHEKKRNRMRGGG